MALVAAWPQTDSDPSWNVPKHMLMPGCDMVQFMPMQQPGVGWQAALVSDCGPQIAQRQQSQWQYQNSPQQSPQQAAQWQKHHQHHRQRFQAGQRLGSKPHRGGATDVSTSIAIRSAGVPEREEATSVVRHPHHHQHQHHRQAHTQQDFEESQVYGDFRSLKHQLQAVNLEDPKAVITVREIKGLGEPGGSTQVEAQLKSYFESFGEVKHVLVPRVPAKTTGQSGKKGASIKGGVRVRSSNVGWVVMVSPTSVNQILENMEHRVSGVFVRVEEFKRSNLDSGAALHQVQQPESSLGSKSTTSSRASTTSPISNQAYTPRDASSSPYQTVGSPVGCHIQMPWVLQPMMTPSVFSMQTHQADMQPQLSEVFAASAEELRLAMPSSYDD